MQKPPIACVEPYWSTNFEKSEYSQRPGFSLCPFTRMSYVSILRRFVVCFSSNDRWICCWSLSFMPAFIALARLILLSVKRTDAFAPSLLTIVVSSWRLPKFAFCFMFWMFARMSGACPRTSSWNLLLLLLLLSSAMLFLLHPINQNICPQHVPSPSGEMSFLSCCLPRISAL